MKKLEYNQTFQLEGGDSLPNIEIAYHTYGELNAERNNVVWVFHALTGNSDCADWWEGLIGAGKILDPKDYFIVCATMLGSYYGGTNPNSLNINTGKAFESDFPTITIRDMVQSHQVLQKHLNIEQIYLGIGGSMGGQQLLEWAIMDKKLFRNTCFLATNASHSPWGIAFNEAQRMAIESDSTLYSDVENAGNKGLAAARAIAMLSYRNYETFHQTQSKDTEKIEGFRASSYQRYQGWKLTNRFDAMCYLSLSKSMDSHNIGRGRGSVREALLSIQSNALVIGISSDILFPITEQKLLAKYIPKATLQIIESPYGHDGFLIEYHQITKAILAFLQKKEAQLTISI